MTKLFVGRTNGGLGPPWTSPQYGYVPVNCRLGLRRAVWWLRQAVRWLQPACLAKSPRRPGEATAPSDPQKLENKIAEKLINRQVNLCWCLTINNDLVEVRQPSWESCRHLGAWQRASSQWCRVWGAWPNQLLQFPTKFPD